MNQKIGYQSWEKSLIAVSIAAFLAAFYLYMNEGMLRRRLFGGEGEILREPIGLLSEKRGNVKREFSGDVEFKPLQDQASLFDQDTLVTASQSGARVTLQDGSVIELGENTMVRLNFEKSWIFGALSRPSQVDVVTGQVKVEAKEKKLILKSRTESIVVTRSNSKSVQTSNATPQKAIVAVAPSPEPIPVVEAPPPPPPEPSPTPTPIPPPIAQKLGVQYLLPTTGTVLKPVSGTGNSLAASVRLKWRFNEKPAPASAPFILEIQRKVEGGRFETIQTHSFEATQREGTIEWKAQKPGHYIWRIKGKNLPETGESSFQVDPQFATLEVLEPLISGEETKSNFYQGKRLRNFDLKVRWKAYPAAQDYQVELSTSPTLDPKLRRAVRKVSATEVLFNDPDLFKGQLYYRVSTELSGGFLAASPIKAVEFNFLPPVPVTPLDQKEMTQKAIAAEGNSLLFTWRKTNFTDEYEIEISRDVDFRKGVVRRRTAENFFVLHSPSIGEYWWRVRSFSKSVGSDASPVRKFQIMP